MEPVNKNRVRKRIEPGYFIDWLISPVTVQIAVIAMILITLWHRWLLLPVTVLSCIWLFIFFSQSFRMPLRMPEDIGGADITTRREDVTETNLGFLRFTSRKSKVEKSSGIMCLGYARKRFFGRELWLTRDDCLRHMQLLATTGSGKTEALMSLQLNALCMGRGMLYSDGKAQTSLAFTVWSLMRRFGQEDNFYVLNFLSGSVDKFENLLINDRTRPQSNSINFFGDATPVYIIQLMESLLPAAGSSDGGWQDKARTMLYGLIYALHYRCKKHGIRMSQSLIQKTLPLRQMAALYQEGKKDNWHTEAINALESYLNTLAGFRMDLINTPAEWDQGVYDQHGYLQQQFSRMLVTFNDVYGHIFATDAGDIDLSDVLHNDRTLVVLIPALELSKSESANLGKLYISAKRMVMARDLGYQLEGHRAEILLSEKFRNRFPFPDIHDELGSYFAPGMDDMAAQYRSLGVMLVISAQDIQRFISQFKGEYQTVNANTLIKWFMALQDEKDTYELAKATAGKDYYAELGSVSRTGTLNDSYQDSGTTYIREKDRISINDLKDLNPGEGFISFKSALVPSSAIYIPDDEKQSFKLPLRINRFININRPTISDLTAVNPDITRFLPASSQEVNLVAENTDKMIFKEDTAEVQLPTDRILNKLIELTMDLDNRCDIEYSPQQRGILLFEAARLALRKK